MNEVVIGYCIVAIPFLLLLLSIVFHKRIDRWVEGKCYECPHLYKDNYGDMCQSPFWCVKEVK